MVGLVISLRVRVVTWYIGMFFIMMRFIRLRRCDGLRAKLG